MRAALLPTPGDVPSVAYWLRNFATWRDQVDELVVFVNGQSDPLALGTLWALITEAGGRMCHSDAPAGHDGALLRLLGETDAEYVVLCEDDAYVRHPGTVKERFSDIHYGMTDIVASPRSEDYAGQWMDWGPYQPGSLLELRHGMWPAFLFARRADLLATDRIFGDRTWLLGETIEGWGEVTPEACREVGLSEDWLHLDTFFGTTFQLRARGLRTRLVHHVRTYDAAATEKWVEEDPPWFHVTNLSTLWDTFALPTRLPGWEPGGGLWTRRVAWWRRMGVDVVAFIRRAGISEADLAAWDARFDPWVTWDDTRAGV